MLGDGAGADRDDPCAGGEQVGDEDMRLSKATRPPGRSAVRIAESVRSQISSS
jgi:hypothetical protein